MREIRAPDAAWMPFVKVIFGFTVLLILAVLAIIIALAKVKEKNSFGLGIILGGLLTLATGFAGWAFRVSNKNGGKPNV